MYFCTWCFLVRDTSNWDIDIKRTQQTPWKKPLLVVLTLFNASWCLPAVLTVFAKLITAYYLKIALKFSGIRLETFGWSVLLVTIGEYHSEENRWGKPTSKSQMGDTISIIYFCSYILVLWVFFSISIPEFVKRFLRYILRKMYLLPCTSRQVYIYMLLSICILY